MSLKVLYDYQIFEQRFGGISNYFAKHLEIMRQGREMGVALPIAYHNNYHLNKINFTQIYSEGYYEKIVKKIIGKKRYRNFTRKTNQELSNRALEKGDFDIFHPTYYDPYFLERIGNKPFVLDIHDMTPEIFPEFFSSKNNIPLDKKLLAHKAAKIIAVSHNTKNDLINLFDIDESRVEVVYHGNTFEGVDIDKIDNFDLKKKLPEKYLLFVGNRGGYKNFYFFLNAISKTLLSDQDLKLVCTGEPFNSFELEFIANLDLKNQVQHFKILSDNDMIVLYKNARVFVFPSLYEGFGLPILEAFSCSCPLVASNVSSIPEIAKDAAIYFEPKNYNSIKNAVELVLYDENLRSNLIDKGLKRLKDFSWQSSVDQTFEIYRNLLKEL